MLSDPVKAKLHIMDFIAAINYLLKTFPYILVERDLS